MISSEKRNLLTGATKSVCISEYKKILEKKKWSLAVKRFFDIVFAVLLLLFFLPLFLTIALLIKISSKGSIFYKQERITKMGKSFFIWKFRTMVENADKIGGAITGFKDVRITPLGSFLRKFRLDELPQLLNVLKGDMSFVGTRPEVPTYVEHYTEEMLATLLLPAGITSLASIRFRNEAALLKDVADAESTYLTEILPQKMAYNLSYIKEFNLWTDLRIMAQTVFAIFQKQ